MKRLWRVIRGTLWTIVWLVMFIAYLLVQRAVLTIGARQPVDNMIIVLPTYLVIYGVLVLVLLWLHALASHTTMRLLMCTTFSHFDRRELKLICLGIGLFLLFRLIFDVLITTRVIPLPSNVQENQQESVLSPVTNYLTSGFAAPVVEELLFRGILMNLWNYSKSSKRRWLVIIIVSAIFGVVHTRDLIAWLIYSFAGLILGYVYTATGKLRDSILLHFINNAVLSLI